MIISFFIGIFLAEFLGYFQHRFVGHVGILRFLKNDIFRARHFHHHHVAYPKKSLLSKSYQASCDIVFHPLGVVVIAILGICTYVGYVSLSHSLSLLFGALLYAILIIDTLHSLHHLDIKIAHKHLLVNVVGVKRFLYLRELHNFHHKYNCNYTILMWWIDWIFGTYKDTETENEKQQNLFPKFSPKNVRSCD